MSWQVQAKGIGATMTIEKWNAAVSECVNTAKHTGPQALECIALVDATVRSEIRRVAEAHRFGQYRYEVFANGHSEKVESCGGKGTVTVSIQVNWTANNE